MANKPASGVHGNRRPTTCKEIKFFGTALSFDEEATKGVPNNKGNASPKFLRTQSSGMLSLSPKPGRKLFKMRDKNSNFDYGAMSARSSSESVCNRGRSMNPTNRTGSCQTMRKLSSVSEICKVNSAGDGVDSDGDCVSNAIQRNEKLHRLVRMRMTRLRSRSASTDSWDDPTDKRYLSELCTYISCISIAPA